MRCHLALLLVASFAAAQRRTENVVRQGQLLGVPEHNARAVVTNPHEFRYPGDRDRLCGLVDERIDRNVPATTATLPGVVR